jgi:heme exporter protein D
MFALQCGFYIFLSFGLYFISCHLLKIPSLAAAKAALNITQFDKRHTKSLDAIIYTWRQSYQKS